MDHSYHRGIFSQCSLFHRRRKTFTKKAENTLSVSTCRSQRWILTMLSLPPQVENFHQQDGEHTVVLYLQIIEVYSHNALSSTTGWKLSPTRWRTHYPSRELPADHSHHRYIFSQYSLPPQVANFHQQGGDDTQHLPVEQSHHKSIFSQCSLFLHRWKTFTSKKKNTLTFSTCGSLLPQMYILTMLSLPSKVENSPRRWRTHY